MINRIVKTLFVFYFLFLFTHSYIS